MYVIIFIQINSNFIRILNRKILNLLYIKKNYIYFDFDI